MPKKPMYKQMELEFEKIQDKYIEKYGNQHIKFVTATGDRNSPIVGVEMTDDWWKLCLKAAKKVLNNAV